MLLKNKRARGAAQDKSDHGPGMLGVLARSPAALAGYLGLHRDLAQGRLSEVERCLVGLMVAQRSGSPYWLSVQTRLARKAGMSADQILDARDGCADRDRHIAVLFLAGKLVINRGELAEADLSAARLAGISDIDITEVIFHVGLNLAAASVSHAARLQLDFPPAPALPAY